MKKGYVISAMVVLVAMSGCAGRKKHRKNADKETTEVRTSVDIPVAEEGITSFFDEDIKEFTLADDMSAKELKGESVAMVDTSIDSQMAKQEDFSWVEEPVQDNGKFKTVYFDFDQYSIREDQKNNLAANIEAVKKAIDESTFFGKPTPVVVIDGHACHSAGSRVYNLALSEKRAKVLADKFVDAGVARECIKIVGRGSEMPAIVDGHPCEGSREEQWVNRRDELRILYS